MLFGLIGRPMLRARTRKPSRPAGGFFRPVVEGLEERVVLDHSGALAPALGPALVQQAAITSLINITDINLTDINIEDGVLTAAGTVEGTLAGLPFTADITNFALQLVPDNPATPAVECSVLNLELAPIHLSLLGLHVDTSPICLEITATEGGGLLGDLLCGLAGGLPDGTLPTAGQLGDLLDGLQDLLGDLLNQNAGPGQGGDSVCTGECEILELAVGPLDLSLLGLNVSLDNCGEGEDRGPVQVCVSATASEGLLGSLLCGLTGPIDGIPLDSLLGTPPGQGGTPPGQGGTPPGQAVINPGQLNKLAKVVAGELGITRGEAADLIRNVLGTIQDLV